MNQSFSRISNCFMLRHGILERQCGHDEITKVIGGISIYTRYSTMVLQLFVGPLIHTDDNEELIIKENVAVVVNDGKIASITDEDPANYVIKSPWKFQEINILQHGKFMTPGFIDCHIHAVQFPNLGLGYDKGLLDWLETYTYPLERKYIDAKFAEQVFEAVVRRTIGMGTTTACYFASLYSDACTILGKIAAKLGQRAFIGKVNINIPRDDGYCESTLTSVTETIGFIKSIELIGSPLVNPIITPRFPLSCDMELMQKLAEIAKAKSIHIQSHVSETKDEIKAVKQAFPHLPSYMTVFDAAGLLTNKTVLAHGVHLEDSELAILKERGTAIIHCPSSNINLKSGICDVQRLKTNDIKVGLGTDVSGGASYSMLNEMRSVLQVSNCLSFTKDNYTPLNYKDVFHMATLGGAKALSIDDKVGNFKLGKNFDALIIDMNTKDSLLDNFKEYTLEENLQRFIYAGDERNIVSVFVNDSRHLET